MINHILKTCSVVISAFKSVPIWLQKNNNTINLNILAGIFFNVGILFNPLKIILILTMIILEFLC